MSFIRKLVFVASLVVWASIPLVFTYGRAAAFMAYHKLGLYLPTPTQLIVGTGTDWPLDTSLAWLLTLVAVVVLVLKELKIKEPASALTWNAVSLAVASVTMLVLLVATVLPFFQLLGA